jgi:hypothetical protein
MAGEADDIEILLARHSSELQTLSEGWRATNAKLDQVFTELHTLTNTLSVLSSQPSFSMSDMLDNIIKVGALAGLAVGAILYVNQAFISSDLTRLQKTDEQVIEHAESLKRRTERLENVLIYKGAGVTLPDIR